LILIGTYNLDKLKNAMESKGTTYSLDNHNAMRLPKQAV
jgi:hypothetical protein